MSTVGLLKKDICKICMDTHVQFFICPRSVQHKWCITCSLKIRMSCPFCRIKLNLSPINFIKYTSQPIPPIPPLFLPPAPQ